MINFVIIISSNITQASETYISCCFTEVNERMSGKKIALCRHRIRLDSAMRGLGLFASIDDKAQHFMLLFRTILRSFYNIYNLNLHQQLSPTTGSFFLVLIWCSTWPWPGYSVKKKNDQTLTFISLKLPEVFTFNFSL